MRNEYEPNTAVTFLLLGLGIGTVLTLVCNPKFGQGNRLEEIKKWRVSGVQPRTKEEGAA